MKNVKGFTLVEILAVIVILAIIAVVMMPVVINTLESGRRNAFLDNAKSLVKAGQNYYTESQLATSTTSLPLLVTFNNGKETTCNNKAPLSYSGKNPDSGNIYVNENGDVEIKVYDKNLGYCAVKNINDKTVKLEKISQSNCHITGKSC